MAQQNKQMRVGAQEGFAHDSVKLPLLATGNMYEVDSSIYFLNWKNTLSVQIFDLFQLRRLFSHTFVSLVNEAGKNEDRIKLLTQWLLMPSKFTTKQLLFMPLKIL
jgi:hypothetical protein